MSDSENFLLRWSRRKREVSHEDVSHEELPRENAVINPPVAAEQPAANDRAPGNDAPNPAAAAIEPGFDPASLPAIETITAQTDIRAFLTDGVPADLARAALRRAWSSDPAIRDFVGLSENSWNFNAPDGIPGFGPIDPAHVRQIVAQVTGALAAAMTTDDARPPASLDQADQPTRPPGEFFRAATACDEAATPERGPRTRDHRVTVTTEEFPQRTKANIAVGASHGGSEDQSTQPRRNHGSALPE